MLLSLMLVWEGIRTDILIYVRILLCESILSYLILKNYVVNVIESNLFSKMSLTLLALKGICFFK